MRAIPLFFIALDIISEAFLFDPKAVGPVPPVLAKLSASSMVRAILYRISPPGTFLSKILENVHQDLSVFIIVVLILIT